MPTDSQETPTTNAGIDPDVQAVADSKCFAELVQRRSRFVRVALTAAGGWFGAFLLLTAYAHGFMDTILMPGLTVAYVLGLSQFVMVWLVTWSYLRTSTRVFVPLEDEALAAVSDRPTTGGHT